MKFRDLLRFFFEDVPLKDVEIKSNFKAWYIPEENVIVNVESNHYDNQVLKKFEDRLKNMVTIEDEFKKPSLQDYAQKAFDEGKIIRVIVNENEVFINSGKELNEQIKNKTWLAILKKSGNSKLPKMRYIVGNETTKK